MTTHDKCGKSWTGNKASHCPVCCETFSNDRAGDKHRVGDPDNRRCLTPQEAGLVPGHRGWTLDRPNRFTVVDDYGVDGEKRG